MTVTTTAAGSITTVAATATTGTGKSTMGQEDFLRLLTTQLQTQDPFAPVDNAEMVSQMATITNSSGIAEMNQSLQDIKEQLTGTRLGDAASWIGKSMLVKSNVAAPDAAGQYAGILELPADASNVSVQLLDGSGAVVKTIDLGAQSAGSTGFYWDGKDDAGNQVGTQPLQVKVQGATPTSVATWATIAAVQSPADGSSSSLITALGTFKPADAIRLG